MFTSITLILASALITGIHQGEAGALERLESPAGVSGMEYDLPGGVIISSAHIPPLDPSTLSNPDDPTSGSPCMEPLEGILPRHREEGSAFWSPGPGTDWGYDRLIYSGVVGTSVDFDTDPVSNTMYAAVDTYHPVGDSLIVFRSTDNGVTWAPFFLGTNTDGTITSARVCVATSSSGTWVIMMGIWHEPDGTDILWTRRVKTDGTGAVWEQVFNYSVTYADMDADIGSTAYAYITFVPETTDQNVYAVRNALNGGGWGNETLIFVTPETTPYPAIAAGYNGTVTVLFIDTRLSTNEELRIKRSTDFGSTWLESQQVSNNTGGFDLSKPDIASTHASTQTLWAISEFSTEGGNIAYYYSTNSGATWTYGAVIGDTGNSTENLPSIRCMKSGTGVTLAYNHDPGDNIMFSYAVAATPTNFSTPVQINDAPATAYFKPAAGWAGNVSAVVYSRSSGYCAYFDSFNNTGIEDAENASLMPGFISVGSSPNPFSGLTLISFTLTGAAQVTASVFDVSGRLVGELISGQSLPAGDHSVEWNGRGSDGAPLSSGVYYCRLNAGGTDVVHRMVLLN